MDPEDGELTNAYATMDTPERTQHDFIAASLGLDPTTMTQYDVLEAIVIKLNEFQSFKALNIVSTKMDR